MDSADGLRGRVLRQGRQLHLRPASTEAVDWRVVEAMVDEACTVLGRVTALGPFHRAAAERFAERAPRVIALALAESAEAAERDPDVTTVLRALRSRARAPQPHLVQSVSRHARAGSARLAQREEGAGQVDSFLHTHELKEAVEVASRDWWRKLTGRPRPRLLVRTAASGLTRDPHARMHGWLGWVTNDGTLLMLDLVRATEHHLARHHRLPETLGLSDDTFFRWEPCAGLVRTGASPGRVLAHEICHVLAPVHHRPPGDPRDIALTAAVRDLAELEEFTGELESLFAQGLKSGAVFRTVSGSERVMLPATLGLNEGLTELLAIRFIQEVAADSPSVLWDRDGFARWGGRIEDGAYRHESSFVADVLRDQDPMTFANDPRATERFSALARASLASSDRCRFDAWLRASEQDQLVPLAGPHIRAGLRLFGRVSARSAQIWRERMRHADAIERADAAVSALRA